MKKFPILLVLSLFGVLAVVLLLQPVGQAAVEPLPTIPPKPTFSRLPVEQFITNLGISFPPVSETEDLAFTLNQLQALNVDIIRIAEDWAFREPTPGEFSWSPLDLRIAWAEQNGISLLLTIQSNGPDWACDPDQQNERSCVFRDADQFRQYITELLSRYPNQIEKLQFGNEWLSNYWYPGQADDFTVFNNIVYDAVQQLSPGTQVVLGGFSTGQLQRMAFCDGLVEGYATIDGDVVTSADLTYCQSEEYLAYTHAFEYVIANARYDMIDLHFYDDVENWFAYYQAVMANFPAQTPVIVSEFGGPNLFSEPYSDQYQADRLALYIETLQQMGVLEAYYFKLVQSRSAHPSHWESGLFRVVEGELLPKPAFSVFQEYSTRP